MEVYVSSILEPRKRIVFYRNSLNNRLQEIACLIRRLFLQIARRPSSFISGIIQPVLWLILFGSLFQNIPLDLFGPNNNYRTFLSCGIIIFTSFTGSLNSGLPLIFDREFGFLNRLLIAPTTSRYAIILAATLFIICTTMIQNSIIVLYSVKFFNFYLNYRKFILVLTILLLTTISISSLSLGLAFVLPGHIEFLALILVINLPTLFASTALAPMYFMPYWLQIISKFNLLTYAIEGIRFIALDNRNNHHLYVIQIFNISLNLYSVITLLTIASLTSFFITRHIIMRRIE